MASRGFDDEIRGFYVPVHDANLVQRRQAPEQLLAQAERLVEGRCDCCRARRERVHSGHRCCGRCAQRLAQPFEQRDPLAQLHVHEEEHLCGFQGVRSLRDTSWLGGAIHWATAFVTCCVARVPDAVTSPLKAVGAFGRPRSRHGQRGQRGCRRGVRGALPAGAARQLPRVNKRGVSELTWNVDSTSAVATSAIDAPRQDGILGHRIFILQPEVVIAQYVRRFQPLEPPEDIGARPYVGRVFDELTLPQLCWDDFHSACVHLVAMERAVHPTRAALPGQAIGHEGAGEASCLDCRHVAWLSESSRMAQRSFFLPTGR
mmetsp:Transcript_21720/g.60675  ORF Transcript_21720/g.60675 Transcript_21720/m.60675 type:complete len:317 (-) Transcript_21720:2-952(-)